MSMFRYMPEICEKGSTNERHHCKDMIEKQRNATQVEIHYSREEERVVRSTLKSHQSQVKQFDSKKHD